jgi:hypothetical protein
MWFCHSDVFGEKGIPRTTVLLMFTKVCHLSCLEVYGTLVQGLQALDQLLTGPLVLLPSVLYVSAFKITYICINYVCDFYQLI